MDEEIDMKAQSLCTLGLALALATHAIPSSVVLAATHCKGLAEVQCQQSAACKWVPKREPAMGVSARKAHCRLDVKAAADIAAKAKKQ